MAGENALTKIFQREGLAIPTFNRKLYKTISIVRKCAFTKEQYIKLASCMAECLRCYAGNDDEVPLLN